ncbi:winged helix-turn-helix domain-containing protein [Glaciibacter flavus]|uniref:Winged helix-turn-helix domain-containing protein n=1 Tax=Orlajensenia flava TaxID=2565934 RepID=A0A4S4G154_9MICO|nr:crosslink repair DNA glycosylase YcaQ family protein [Glaciibacter flavus]THG36202.1 winged helix-turn-helix domain-containing protein [Glaciibacter flavus]
MVDSVSPALARRVALAAQGFGRPHPPAVGTRQLNGVIDRLQLLQLDSVNVFERSHYLPVFARLGAYDKGLLDRLTFPRSGRYVEYWAHEAAIIPVETWPLMRWRMQVYRDYFAQDGGWAAANRPMLDWLRDELAANGPLPASAIEHESNVRRGPWWGWSDVKRGLEVLFRQGDVVTAGRTRFERTYALPEQVLPSSILERVVSREDAHVQLIEQSARAHGIGTEKDLADYFRLKRVDVRPAIARLVDEGSLLPVTVDGWRAPAWLHRDARLPRRIGADALLSPFDPVVWERARTERMFGFHYRIEIYTPAEKRIHGYYNLPILIDDALVGRIDLKNDRQARVLRVQSAWLEEGALSASVDEIAERTAAPLRSAAGWQGLENIAVVGRGTLSPALESALSGAPAG